MIIFLHVVGVGQKGELMSRAIDADALEKEGWSLHRTIQVDKNTSEYQIKPLKQVPTIELERKTDIPRDVIEHILWKETVSTNPYNFIANEKFIKFMDDPEIASFGRWQHANGFNTALVTVKCDLDKIPDSESQRRKKGKWIKITTGAMREKYMCSICGRIIEEDGIERFVQIRYPFCHCGAEMMEE